MGVAGQCMELSRTIRRHLAGWIVLRWWNFGIGLLFTAEFGGIGLGEVPTRTVRVTGFARWAR